MNLKLPHTLLLTGLLACSALAQEHPSAAAPTEPPDRARVSYALGMNMALETRSANVVVDPAVVEKSMKDVMAGKPTELNDSDLLELLKQARATGLAKEAETDQHKVSYAMGMRLAVQLKRTGAEVDSQEFGQGLRDVLDGKHTRFSQTEIPTLFRQAQTYSQVQLAKKNKTEGETFLARNAKTPGITVLPSGLQYRILEPGTGKVPATNDLIFIKYRGSLPDGREFDHSNHFLTQPTGGIVGWQQALQRMRVGAKWQLFVPADIGFGQEGEPVHQVGPDATLIYELEMLEIVQPHDPRVGTGRVGHGLGGDEELPPSPGAGKGG